MFRDGINTTARILRDKERPETRFDGKIVCLRRTVGIALMRSLNVVRDLCFTGSPTGSAQEQSRRKRVELNRGKHI